MRVKFGYSIFEVDKVEVDGRFVVFNTPNGVYSIDCETPNGASWLMSKMLHDGYFNATGVDYDNTQEDSWFKYCLNKTGEQKVFAKWINGGMV